MSFGFGVGDFLAAATLAWKIGVALRGTKQTSESLKLLIDELEFTSQALNQAGNILENAGLQASAMNVVQLGLSRCHGDLQKLDEILNKYHQATPGGTSGGSGNNFKNWISRPKAVSGLTRCLKELKWELCEKDGVNELRENINKSVGLVSMILSASGIQTMRNMERQLDNQLSIKRIEAQIPKELGYMWAYDHKPVVLEDALGRKMQIPYELYTQWEAFLGMLKVVSKDPGSTWIGAGRYNIKSVQFELLPPQKWSQDKQPNMKLIMSMKYSNRIPEQYFRTQCPICVELYRGYLKSTTLQDVQRERSSVPDRIEEVEDDNENDSIPAPVVRVGDMHPNQSTWNKEDLIGFKRVAGTVETGPFPAHDVTGRISDLSMVGGCCCEDLD